MNSTSPIAAVLYAIVFAPALHAQMSDVIRGRVVGPDSLPIEGANVKATSYQGNVSKTTATNKTGLFTLIFVNGEGDYWIDVTKIGFSPKRFEVRKLGDEEVILANARLTAAATLDAMDVVARRNRLLPNRNGNSPDAGGGDRTLTGNAVPPDQAGNLAAMAATVAGIQIVPGLDGATDAFSMLGLTSDQNNTTFEGLGSGVTALPPDILAMTSIRPYPFDVSIGGFSGAQIAIQTIPGANFSRSAVTNVNITPPLEWASASALAQGQKYTNVRLGGNAAGPIVIDRAFYNSSYNIGREFSDLRTLANTSASGLAAAGVSPDSAARLIRILQSQHIPVDGHRAPTMRARDVAQVAANVDLMPSASGSGNSFTVGGAVNYQRTQPVSRGGLVFTTPAHSGETSFWGANGTVAHSNYFGLGILTKTTLGLAASGSSTSPYETLPEGSVRVSSVLPDGTSSIKSLSFGGSSMMSSLANTAAQLTNQLSWYSDDNTHTIKLSTGLIHDAFRTDVNSNRLGTFMYNSLVDLEAGRASSFARTLAASTRTGSQFTGSVSLGDYWRPTDGFQVQYGVRADANRFLGAPAFNADVLSAFGVDNRAVPNRVYVSPRIGMQWYYGSSPVVAYAPGAARPPRAVIHLGAGVFQNMAPSQLISGPVSSTGLASSTQSITCVGTATPFPNWNAFLADASAVPTRCADGQSGALFATTAPNVMLFDPDFRQAKSLRAAGDWSGPVLDNRFVVGVQAIVSNGLDQEGVVDINLNPTTRFTLVNEGGRPVFVAPSAVVPATGAVATVGSRVSPAYQHVWQQQSGFNLTSRQLSINVKALTANRMLHWDATYTLLSTHERFSGFTSTTGNPFAVQSGLHLQPGRHTMTVAWNDFPIFDVLFVTAALRVMSGQRYTPLIAQDVNGDGMVNDRAFIPDPSRMTDSAMATAMRSVLASASPAVRSCLGRQINTLAARGSCQAPWTVNGGLLVKFNPRKIGLPRRATVTLVLQNPLALADLAIHGGNAIHGWGQNIAPDQNLLFVRAFDPVSRQFRYDVNQRFGSTRPQQSATYSLPFVSFGVNVDIGMPRERQLLTQRLDAGRVRTGTKGSPEAMTAFGTSSIPNPMLLILSQGDSLGLTRAQADSLGRLSRAFVQFADSVWTPVGRYLAALPAAYSTGEAYRRYVQSRERTVDFLLTIVPDVKRTLTAEQRRRLPLQVANYLDERVLHFLRSSTSGDVSSIVIR